MNKIFSYILILAATLLTSTGCTRNNGNIGDWFGTWKMTAMTVDGADNPDYHRDIIWKFQNDIVTLSRPDETAHSSDTRFGTWVEKDDTITLCFGHSDNNHPAGTGIYAPFKDLKFDSETVTLKVMQISRSSITLHYDSPSGAVIIYYLKKWG